MLTWDSELDGVLYDLDCTKCGKTTRVKIQEVFFRELEING